MWYLNGFDSEAEVEKLRRECQQNKKLLAALNDITRQKVPLKRLESTDEFGELSSRFESWRSVDHRSGTVLCNRIVRWRSADEWHGF